MRLTEEQLKAGWLHPNRIVRCAVAKYFTESFTRDPDVTRWAIRGVEEFGWEDFLLWQHMFCQLPLVEDSSFEWVCQQLERTDAGAPSDNLKLHLSRMVADADISILKRQQSRLLAIDAFRPTEREHIVARLQVAQLDPAECWQRLEEHCRMASVAETFKDAEISEATRLLEPLIRAGDRFASQVLEILGREAPDPDVPSLDHWLIGLMIILAGQLQLEEAAADIWKFWETDWDWYNDEVMRALTRIGTPSVVRLAQERYPQSEWHVRMFAHNLLKNIHCEESIAAIDAVIPSEEDDFLRGQLGIAASAQFDDRLVPLALQIWDEDPDDVERDEIRELLIAFSHLSGQRLPQRSAWEREVHARDERMIRMRNSDFPKSLFEKLASQREQDGDDVPDEFEDFEDDAPIPAPTLLERASPAGRNDPCPCGSGKKYKKCCLRSANAK